MERRQRHLFLGIALLVALVAGAAAGVVASVSLSRSLGDYAAELLLAKIPATPSSTQTRANPSSYDDAVTRIAQVVAPSVAVITPTTIDSRTPSSWIGEHDAVGYGVVVSTDGWVLVTDEVVQNFVNPLTQADVWIDGARHRTTRIVADSLTEFVLLKVDADGLDPVAFGASEDTVDGARVFVAEGTRALRTTSVVRTRAGDIAVVPAEQYPYQWSLASMPGAPSPVFTSSGEVLAFTTSSGALPIHAGSTFVQSVFRGGAPLYAGFGAGVVDISAALNMEENLAQGRNDGALVMTVLRASPAFAAGVVVGDVITAVDDVRVDASTTLADLLRLYKPGDRATLTVVQGGEVHALDVTFGVYDDLVY